MTAAPTGLNATTELPTRSPAPTASNSGTTLTPSADNNTNSTTTLAPTPTGNSTTAAPTPSSSSNNGNSTTTTAPPSAAIGDETTEEFLTRTLTDDGALQTAGTPQNLALAALETNFGTVLSPNNGVNDRRFITQIYVLNTMYYALGGDEWVRNSDWVGPTAPCDGWEGVVCDDQSEVINIDLAANDLLGSLPSEIQGLSGLRTYSHCSVWLSVHG